MTADRTTPCPTALCDTEQNTLAAATKLWIGEYYDEDGVALRVGDTLFRISRSRLTQDSSVFRDMFSLPRPQSAVSGEREGTMENPIVLAETDPRAFLHYLWVLYERPPVIESFLESKDDVFKLRKLLAILILTHKYENEALHSWAIKYSQRTLFTRAIPLYRALVDLVVQAIALLRCGQDERTADEFELALRRYLVDDCTTEVRKDVMRSIDAVGLILACDAWGLDKLAAEARYVLLLQPRSHWESDCRLTQDQAMRLLCGSDALLRRWSCIRDEVLKVDQAYNARLSRARILDVEVDTRPYDLRAKLVALHPIVENFCSRSGLILERGLRIRDVISREQKTLADHMDVYFDVSKWSASV
ncbi:hypothetical protein EXIGLDRAFT_744067 [Exidia glandulosa HHB12029]|uniref:BTB domain-containing protein n=1 Tax=Exidia glandulosa HHB12029 TaxID=1314781 RepID=A0A166BQG2_EXIGL|nr:hypothetical protein EXIGLDRAFT_744067 [Exidia glandulosa HHB12029]